MMKHSREPEGTLGYAVKGIPYFEVADVLDKFKFKTKVREHQGRALYLGIVEDSWLYALDMGLGKTLIGLYIAEMVKKLEKKNVRMLVTCPAIVMRQWRKEVGKHSDLTIDVIDMREAKDKLRALRLSKANITVVSHTWLVTLFGKAEKSREFDEFLMDVFSVYDILVVDEAHILRNPDTKGFKGYRKYLMGIPKRYLMTGTPIGNSYTGVWSLYYVLDRGKTFGKSYSDFLRMYFRGFYNGRYVKYTLRKDKREEFMRKFWERAVRWEESECNDLPGKTFTVLPVRMSAEQERAYDEILSDGFENDAQNVFKLMGVTAGVGFDKSQKLEALENLVEEVCVEGGRQLVVWCWLRNESEMVVERLKKKFKKLRIEGVKGESNHNKKGMILESWERGKVDVLVANQKSLGVGVDLFEANVCVFFSNNLSVIDRKQSEKRIHRTGQTRHCTYVDIVCENTVDELILGFVRKAKESFSELTKDEEFWKDLKRQRESGED